MYVKMLHFPGKTKEEGAICVAEGTSSQIPFEIRRAYYSYGVSSGIVRGHHAHKILKQILICLYGAIEVSLDDGKGETKTFVLNDPSKGLFVGPDTWRNIKWLIDNSVLLVLASEHYTETDYIRNYDDFIAWVRERGDEEDGN